MTSTREEDLEHILIIYYLVQFKKNSSKVKVQTLIDSKSEVNAIHLTFAKQLGLPIRLTDVGAQKIDGTMLDTYKMIVAAFSIVNKANQVRFFEQTFLMANVNPEVIFGMLFLNLSGTDVDFLG